jgi:hypothetical protein
MSEQTQKLWSATAPGNTITVPGGFDCSGFVWRVYKLEPYPDAPALAAVLRGRTTYAMSGEVPKSERIDRASIEPGDVLFFGSRGPASKPSEIGHMGIYVGQRLVRPLVERRRDAAAARGLVCDDARVGAAAVGRVRSRHVGVPASSAG